MVDKKELKRQYKESRRPMGVYRILNKESGNRWGVLVNQAPDARVRAGSTAAPPHRRFAGGPGEIRILGGQGRQGKARVSNTGPKASPRGLE